MHKEIPVTFTCNADQLLGMVHAADPAESRLGVLLVVGGPQYRAGSHRQFLLLARMLATNGFPVMRFDYRGMGDAEGEARNFLEIDEDIRAAVDTFLQTMPDLNAVAIWGLCDAAAAGLFYAYQDPRIKGLVLLNPWVYTEQGAAKTYLQHYYLQRLLSGSFWRKVFSFQFNFRDSLSSLIAMIKKAAAGKAQPAEGTVMAAEPVATKVSSALSLPERVRACLRRFEHPVLLLLSGRDLTADEFKGVVAADPEWQKLLAEPRLTRRELAEADHTFSSQAWRDQVAQFTLEWLTALQQNLNYSSKQ